MILITAAVGFIMFSLMIEFIHSTKVIVRVRVNYRPKSTVRPRVWIVPVLYSFADVIHLNETTSHTQPADHGLGGSVQGLVSSSSKQTCHDTAYIRQE